MRNISMIPTKLAFVLAATTACATPIDHYEGIAYDAKGREVYRESHWLSGSHGSRELVVLFRCPDGKAFARKHVRESDKPEAPSFELLDARIGYHEGVRSQTGGSREVFFQRRANQAEQHAPLPDKADLVLDAGFDAFIRKRWDALIDGKKQTMNFLVPSRLSTIGFLVRRLDDGVIAGTPVRRFRLELNAWYSFAIPAMDVAYDAKTRLLREYKGIANIRDNAGKSLNVRIDFPPSARTSGIDPRAAQNADEVKLDGTCIL
jgi:hypothetical protein